MDPAVEFILTCIFSVVSLISIGLLLAVHGWTSYKVERLCSPSNKHSNIHVAMSFLTITFVALAFLCTLIALLLIYFCLITLGFVGISILYQISKCCINIMFILRLHHIYGNSNYGYNVKVLYFCGILLIIIYIILCIFGSLSSITYSDAINIYETTITFCGRVPYPIYLWSSSAVDIITSITTSIAFIYPMVKILKDHSSEELTYMIIKISILAVFICISSLFAYIITATYMLGGSIPFLIDVPVNCLCVILMTGYYDKQYEKLCCCCIKCVKKKIFKFQKINLSDNVATEQQPQTDHESIQLQVVEIQPNLETIDTNSENAESSTMPSKKLVLEKSVSPYNMSSTFGQRST